MTLDFETAALKYVLQNILKKYFIVGYGSNFLNYTIINS